MDIRLTVNGKEVALSEEQIKLLGLAPEKKKTGYERVGKGHIYYRLSGTMGIGNYADTHEESDLAQDFYSVGNYFNDFDLAANVARATELIWKIQRFAAEDGGIPSQKEWTAADGSIPRKAKYYIEFNTTSKQLYAAACNRVRTPGVVYFLRQDACEKAIEVYRDELIWYFTEYEPMLH